MDLERIGAFLALLRKEQGQTQEQLGQRLGVSNKTVSRWETGSYLPPVEMLQKLSELYGVSINELLSGQRLDPQEYRTHAEENMKAALCKSAFSLGEKIEFYKRKWNREHIFELVLAILAAAVLLAAGLVWKGWLSSAAVLWIAGYLMWRNHRRMIYVEDRAFDGTGSR